MDLVITQPPFVMTLREEGKLKCENHQMALIDLFSNPSNSINVRRPQVRLYFNAIRFQDLMKPSR